jgi:hypothetical protein
VSETPLFTPRMLAAWIAAACLATALSLVFLLHGESTDTAGASTFSRSAVGHAGIADVLRKRGFTVLQSQGDSLHKLGRGGLLVLAEPDLRAPDDRSEALLLTAPTVLLVLPKWLGTPDRDKPAWVSATEPMGVFGPQSILERAIPDAKVVRSTAGELWTSNGLGPMPHLSEPPQLMWSERLRPIIASKDGILLGELVKNGRRLWVLSDPDVIDNHGLGDGNAPLAVAIFDALAPRGPVVFDETIHGFAAVPPDLFKLLARQPFAAIFIQAAVALALLLWASAIRFGAPEAAPEPWKAGKRDLVRNVARLFRYAGYQDVLVRRYVEETIRDVAHRLHAPNGLDDAARIDWVRRAGAGRGVDGAAVDEQAALASRHTAAEALRLAREVWNWKQEMLNGRAGSANDRGGHSRRSRQGGDRPG